MRSLAQELATEMKREKARVAEPVRRAPAREYTGFDRPRSIYGWVEGGQVKPGHEANGLALPERVVETLGLPDPPQYVVIGEERYADGRWYLDFAVSEAWTKSLVPPCEECSGTGGRHLKVDFEDPNTHKVRQVRCPNAPMLRR